MSSKKLLIKNTSFLYIRMLITMIISLYTSRVIIEALGFTDYGIYAVVGGVVGLISFMHTSLSGATTRFMNFEMGKNNLDNLKTVFNSAIIIHFSLAILVLIIGETIGLWFLMNKLTIPADRLFAAQVVYHISLLSIMMTIMQIPYDAAIIAHQKMSIYAYISIIESVLKLVVAYLVLISYSDKLIVYAGFLLLSSIITRLMYQIYCRRNFEECRFKWIVDKKYIKSILSFFSWDLYGNLSVSIKYQGIQMLQNIFFGPIVNASAGIASTVSGVVTGFATNFTVATKPQIFQAYAEGKIQEMIHLVFLSSRITYFLMFILSIPFIVETDFFVSLWLVKTPEWAIIFCKLTFIQILVNSLFNILNQPVHATGKIKMLSFIGGTIIILNLPITYLVLKLGGNQISAYIVAILLSFIGGIVNIMLVKKVIPEFPATKYFRTVCLKNIFISFLGSIPGCILFFYLSSNFINSIFIIMVLILTNLIVIYFLGLEEEERFYLKNRIQLLRK